MKTTRKILSVLLILAMVLSVAPFAFAAEEATFVKITAEQEDWSGTYLIVYEEDGNNLAFDASLSKLDAEGNSVSVSIADGKISIDKKYAVTIEKAGDGYAIKAGSSYIYGKSGSNALKTGSDAVELSIAYNATEACVDIVSNNTTLRYNNATTNGSRFRFYKSGQQAIQLYKLEENVHEHDYGTAWKYDENNHWHACECGEKADEAAHVYGEWVVVNEATETAEGLKERKCECGHTQQETIAKLPEQPKDDSNVSTAYIKVTDGKLVSGTYVLVAGNGYAPTILDSNWLLSAKPVASGNEITDTKDAVLILTVDGNTVTITDADGNNVINQTGKTKLVNSEGAWHWNYDEESGTFTFDDGNTEEGKTRYLASAVKYEGKFRAYANPSAEPNQYGEAYYHQFTLYKQTTVSNAPNQKPVEDNKENSKTGDATALVAISAAMLLAATGVVAVVSNKKHF